MEVVRLILAESSVDGKSPGLAACTAGNHRGDRAHTDMAHPLWNLGIRLLFGISQERIDIFCSFHPLPQSVPQLKYSRKHSKHRTQTILSGREVLQRFLVTD